jgi:hypothetical protein
LRKYIHVTYSQRGYKNSCKFWLDPEIELDENKKGDFTKKELLEIKKRIKDNKELLLLQLEKFFNLEKVKAIQL